jgi:beta-aspartyl-peptidase (threonine type)
MRLARLCLLPLLLAAAIVRADAPPAAGSPALAIHGGAGTMSPESLTPELRAEVEATLEAALTAGYDVLARGGSALDGVVAAIRVLEDSPRFNAGRGAVFTHSGGHELDASIMDGQTLAAGAVGGVVGVRNPILLARRVMDASPHVLLTGDGALDFAREQSIELEPPAYFDTDYRRQQLERAREQQARTEQVSRRAAPDYLGTVGAVALDREGRLAAGTSTGGMTNKRWGRLGDSPIIGAGTYASDEAGCAVSATGHGEYFIRAAVAHDICARALYGGGTVAAAARTVVLERLPAMGGSGGVITIDGAGRIEMPFNTPGMYRGSVDAAGRKTIAIFRDAPAGTP